MRVEINHRALRELELSLPVRADLARRAERVTRSAARRARALGTHEHGLAAYWSEAMDHQAGTDERGPYEDVSWRLGKHTDGGESRGHFLLFGTSQPHHPPHLDVLLGALDEA